MTRYLRRFVRRDLVVLAALPILCLGTADLYAGIVSYSNVNLLLGPPFAPAGGVNPGVQTPPFQSTPILFPELPGIGIVGTGGTGPLNVDHDGSVTPNPPAPVKSGSLISSYVIPGVLPEGTPFESYFFHFDPRDDDPDPEAFFYGDPNSVTITFDTPIIGLQFFSSALTPLNYPPSTPYTGTLEDGDEQITANGGQSYLTYYPGGISSRGLEEDAFDITNFGKTIELAGEVAGSEIDQVRIIVSAVPEPTSGLLGVMGLLGLQFLGITRVAACRRP